VTPISPSHPNRLPGHVRVSSRNVLRGGGRGGGECGARRAADDSAARSWNALSSARPLSFIDEKIKGSEARAIALSLTRRLIGFLAANKKVSVSCSRSEQQKRAVIALSLPLSRSLAARRIVRFHQSTASTLDDPACSSLKGVYRSHVACALL